MNNSFKCLILNPIIDHGRDITNEIEINALKDKVNFRYLNCKICNKQKKNSTSIEKERSL